MNKKIAIVSILTIFMLVAISFASVAGIDDENKTKRRVSPLFRIRSNNLFREKLIENFKVGFLKNRLFFNLEIISCDKNLNSPASIALTNNCPKGCLS